MISLTGLQRNQVDRIEREAMQNDALFTDNNLRGWCSRGACRREGGVHGGCAQRVLDSRG